jgi:hypothetical protein
MHSSMVDSLSRLSEVLTSMLEVGDEEEKFNSRILCLSSLAYNDQLFLCIGTQCFPSENEKN